ncbi:hypothetical protein PF66_02289 [Pseudomonas asplenii]|uniref:Uncharacterized protein n=1 Tax=Pseudomonas asplenii TaxID=53407 RepID=A0A0N0E4M0_9PSED|nr:hypothetical protein PF66_02289 [Pseudomonas fuscovaginae]
MALRIVYQIPGEPVAVMTPCECGLTIEDIGIKDVPAGVAFWVVQEAVIPLDPEARLGWSLSVEQLGAPSGVGGSK